MQPESLWTERVYTGFVSHDRQFDISHRFRYPLWMVWARLTDSTLPWLVRPRFNRYMSSRQVQDLTGTNPGHGQSTVWLLTQPSLLGRSFNPVSFYCVEQGGAPQKIVAHITNTPWDEQHCYVLDCSQGDSWTFDKCFHVSPFLPMDLSYTWRIRLTAGEIGIDMRLVRNDTKVFSAQLLLHPDSHDRSQGAALRLRYPLQNLTNLARIYWQAALLKLKGATFYDHPKHNALRPDNVQ